MERLTDEIIEALLKLNPQVDREIIRSRRERILKEGSQGAFTGDSASPYRGKRATYDERLKTDAIRRLRRTRYQSM